VTRVVQAPGEYVITFPRAYHGGFSNGFCIGEAVNFSIGDWFPFGLDAAQRYRRLSRLPILAHDELLCLEGLAIHGKVLVVYSASVHVWLYSVAMCVLLKTMAICRASVCTEQQLMLCNILWTAWFLFYFSFAVSKQRSISRHAMGMHLGPCMQCTPLAATIMFIGQMNQALSCTLHLLYTWRCLENCAAQSISLGSHLNPLDHVPDLSFPSLLIPAITQPSLVTMTLARQTLPICGAADEIDSATWQQQPQADMHATLMHCFLQLIREQHAQRAQLAKRGLTQALRLPFSASMPCCRPVPCTSLLQSMLHASPTFHSHCLANLL
jgi:hypothetical protein